MTSEQIIDTSQATGTVQISNLVHRLLPVCKSIRHLGAAEALGPAYHGIFGQGSEIVPNAPGLHLHKPSSKTIVTVVLFGPGKARMLGCGNR